MKNGSEKNEAIILAAVVACTMFGVNSPKQIKVV